MSQIIDFSVSHLNKPKAKIVKMLDGWGDSVREVVAVKKEKTDDDDDDADAATTTKGDATSEVAAGGGTDADDSAGGSNDRSKFNAFNALLKQNRLPIAIKDYFE